MSPIAKVGLVFGSLALLAVCAFCAMIVASDIYYRQNFGIGGGRSSPDIAEDATPVEIGEAIYDQRCSGCHAIDDSSRVGPQLAGLYGSEVPLEGGTTVAADAEYLRESILDPSVKVREGYPDAMPSFDGRLSDDEVDGLIEFIKSLE